MGAVWVSIVPRVPPLSAWRSQSMLPVRYSSPIQIFVCYYSHNVNPEGVNWEKPDPHHPIKVLFQSTMLDERNSSHHAGDVYINLATTVVRVTAYRTLFC